MSNEEINRKIAEACGWVWSMPDECYYRNGSPIGKKIPDYCSDLNAMHEAEETLSGENQRREYVYCLADLMKPGGFTVLAPAHSRALAFLKTVAPKL